MQGACGLTELEKSADGFDNSDVAEIRTRRHAIAQEANSGLLGSNLPRQFKMYQADVTNEL